MPYFKVDFHKIDPRLPSPDDKYFADVIFKNNKKFSVVTPIFPFEVLVIECENKPRDMPVFGIFWLETHLTQRAPDLGQAVAKDDSIDVAPSG